MVIVFHNPNGDYVGLKVDLQMPMEDNMEEFYSRLYKPINYVISESGLVGI